MAKPAISACAWRIEHADLARAGFTTSFEEVMRWAGLGAVVIPLPISRPSVASKPVEMVPVGELSRRAQVTPLRVLSPVDVAACAARWFSAAGSNIAFPACPTDVAREEGSAKAGFLAAAMELRDLLAQSSDGRQALRDIGFEPLRAAESTSPIDPAADDASASVRVEGLDLNLALAGVTEAVDTAGSQNALVLADIEARLTQEVRGLIAALTQFSGNAELICKEIPDSAHFTKLVTSLLVLIGLQLSHALGKGLDKPIFFDDGAEYLHELNLCLSDFVREVDLDGRRFLAIALVDKQPGKLSSSSDGADQC